MRGIYDVQSLNAYVEVNPATMRGQAPISTAFLRHELGEEHTTSNGKLLLTWLPSFPFSHRTGLVTQSKNLFPLRVTFSTYDDGVDFLLNVGLFGTKCCHARQESAVTFGTHYFSHQAQRNRPPPWQPAVSIDMFPFSDGSGPCFPRDRLPESSFPPQLSGTTTTTTTEEI